MRKNGCPECQRLWQEYSHATFEHVKIDGQKKMAELGRAGTAELSRAYDEATQRRDTAQRRMKEHEATHLESDASGMA
jgi:hypothetical protein